MSIRAACAFAVIMALAASPSVEAADGGGAAAGLERLRRANQAATKEAYPDFSEEAAFSAAIKGYLSSIDAYSTYISPQEAQALRAADSHAFVGVGMDIIQDHKGFLYCLPYAGSPAEQAGIGYGDMLRSIDSAQAEAMSLHGIQNRIRGKEGSAVTLGIVNGAGLREVTVTRGPIVRPSVELLRGDTVPRIRVMRFDQHTVGELRAALASIVAGSPLILDLRGNIGGDLQVAVECAGLFLPEGALIASMRKKNEPPAVLRAKAGTRATAGAVVLWQDRFTASSAEVFCAALSQHKRGRTVGERSFGKGVTQRVLPAGDGGLYVITNAELLPPNGKAFDRTGLEPDLPVARQSASAHQDFLRRTHEAFSLKP
jgi:carboxyl-terminal processing protease